MEHKQETLSDYLTQPNPTFLWAESYQFSRKKKKNPGSGCSTRPKNSPIPKEIRAWEEFSLETIRGVFNGELARCLEQDMDGLHDFSSIHASFLRVYDEDALQSLLVKWHQSIVLEALDRTAPDLLKQKVSMVKGGQAILVHDKSHKFAPDWAGIGDLDRGDGVPKPSNILPGDTKPSWTWQSSFIKISKNRKILESQWPLRQLLNYCLLTFSRYGYIITDKELVALRVSCEVPEGSINCDQAELTEIYWDDPIVEFCAIPWESTGRDMLTMNLALWALHILAANNGHIQTSPYCALAEEVLLSREGRKPVSLAAASFDTNNSFSGELLAQEHDNDPAPPDLAKLRYDQTDEDDTEPDEDQGVTSAQASFEGSILLRSMAGRYRQRDDSSRTRIGGGSKSKVDKVTNQARRTSSISKIQRGKAKGRRL